MIAQEALLNRDVKQNLSFRVCPKKWCFFIITFSGAGALACASNAVNVAGAGESARTTRIRYLGISKPGYIDPFAWAVKREEGYLSFSKSIVLENIG